MTRPSAQNWVIYTCIGTIRPRPLLPITSRVPGSLSSERVSRFKKGVGEYLTVNGVQRLLEAIDAETLLDEALAEEVPAEEGARIAGRVVGRVVAKEATGYLPLGSIVEAAVGRTVGEGAVALVIEYGSVAAIVARVSSASERVDFDTRTRRIADFDVRGRTNGVCDLLPGLPNVPDAPVLGGTETVWEDESATTVPVAEETAGD